MGLLRLPFSLNNEQRVAIGWLGGSHQPGFWCPLMGDVNFGGLEVRSFVVVSMTETKTIRIQGKSSGKVWTFFLLFCCLLLLIYFCKLVVVVVVVGLS